MSCLLMRVPGKRFFQRNAHPDSSNMGLAHSSSQPGSGPRRRLALEDFPAEIILHLSSFLDAEAIFALQQTNRRLRHTIQPSTKQLTQVHERRYLAKWMDATKHDKQRLFCHQCMEKRPRSAFSASEIMRFNKEHEATCLRHAQFWVCPHHFLSYDDFYELRGRFGCYYAYRFYLADTTNSCKNSMCKCIFEHNFCLWKNSEPWVISIDSMIEVARVLHRRGPNHVWDSVRGAFTQSNLDAAMSLIQAPICDHLLLSDRTIRDDFSINDLDLRDFVWNRPAYLIEYESARGKERSCAVCAAMGAWTKWRFQVWVRRCGNGAVRVELRVLLSRSAGTFDRRDGFFDQLIYLFSPSYADRRYAERGMANVHRRCHGFTEASVTKFRASWDETGSKVPLLLPEVVPKSSAKRPQAKKKLPKKKQQVPELTSLLPSFVVQCLSSCWGFVRLVVESVQK